MTLKLNRPLVFFDIETTGTNTSSDRLIDICILKLYPDGKENIYSFRCNPGMPIPIGATKIHGIKDDDVKSSPLFSKIATELFSLMKDCDYAGFNIVNFDVPLLMEEFRRVGINWPAPETQFLDAFTVFIKKEQRTLTAAYKFFCNKELANAHSADADVLATRDILLSQIERYPDIGEDIQSIASFCNDGKLNFDLAGKLQYDKENNIVFGFGKYRGEEVFNHLDYLEWMLSSDFPAETKDRIKEIMARLV